MMTTDFEMPGSLYTVTGARSAEGPTWLVEHAPSGHLVAACFDSRDAEMVAAALNRMMKPPSNSPRRELPRQGERGWAAGAR